MKELLKMTAIYLNYLRIYVLNGKVFDDRVIALHDIDDLNKFEEKMVFLKDNFCCSSLSNILSGKVNEKSIAVTFDDGYKEWAYGVYDILEKYSIPATFFVNSTILTLNKGDRDNYIRNNLRRKSKLQLLDKDELLKVSKHGLFSIGGHSLSHYDLGTIDDLNLMRKEIIQDKKNIESIIGETIDYFAFPFGRGVNISKLSVSVLNRSSYKKWLSIIPGAFSISDKLIPRISLSIHDSNLFWFASLNGAYVFMSKKDMKILCK